MTSHATWTPPRGRRGFTAVARDVTQLLATAGALHLLPTWLALQEEGWRQRRRNRVGTLGVSPAELCGGHDERGAAGMLGLHTTRSRATNYRHVAALEVLGLLSRERLRGSPRRGPGAAVLYALFATSSRTTRHASAGTPQGAEAAAAQASAPTTRRVHRLRTCRRSSAS